MMLYPPMSVLAEKAGSRYLLVNLVARRARNIAAAAPSATYLTDTFLTAPTSSLLLHATNDTHTIKTSAKTAIIAKNLLVFFIVLYLKKIIFPSLHMLRAHEL